MGNGHSFHLLTGWMWHILQTVFLRRKAIKSIWLDKQIGLLACPQNLLQSSDSLRLHHSGITIKIYKSLEWGGCTLGLMQARASLQNPCWVTSWHSPLPCDLFWGPSLLGHTKEQKCPFPQETLHLGPGQHNLTCSRCRQSWDSFLFHSTSFQVWLCLWCLTSEFCAQAHSASSGLLVRKRSSECEHLAVGAQGPLVVTCCL